MYDLEETIGDAMDWSSGSTSSAPSAGDPPASDDAAPAFLGGGASADSAALFAGMYDDGNMPSIGQAATSQTSTDVPWPPPSTMGWFEKKFQAAGDWALDLLMDPFGSHAKKRDNRRLDESREKNGPMPAPAPIYSPVAPFQPPPSE